MYYIIFFVPKSHADLVKEAMFSAGAGEMGHYSKCSFESSGMGQFSPMNGSRPFIGQVGKIEHVEEIKVEIFCQERALRSSIAALKSAHPYETPAYYVIKTVNVAENVDIP